MIKGKDKIRLAEALAFFNSIKVDQSQDYVSFKLKSQSSFISSVHIDLGLEIFDLLCN